MTQLNPHFKSAWLGVTGLFVCVWLALPAWAGQGKLQETAGVTQVEGSSGGGLVPWATLAGYDSRDEISMSVFTTRVGLDDYRLYAYGVAASFYDRLELSVAHQTFDLLDTPLEINQNIFGAKVRLTGDVIYSSWPQISAGLQYKKLLDTTLASALGAKETDSGTDFYLAASKAHLGAVFGYNLLWNLTVRATKANQFGLLGYGGEGDNRYELMAEGSLALLLSRSLAIGIDYRQKPDNLPGLEEQDGWDVFIAYLPNKHFNATVAWADLGTIAGSDDQSGLYVSLTGYLW